MRLNDRTRSVPIAALVLSVAIWSACNKAENTVSSAAASTDGGKIPITTKSEDAKNRIFARAGPI